MRTGVLLVVLFLSGCTLFSKDERLLAECKKTNGTRVGIYFVALGATTEDVIQVREVGKEHVIWVSEEYNYLDKSELLNDSTIMLILSDTGFAKSAGDTIIVNLNK